MLAATCELLLQSHVPGVLSLLPALPLALAERGMVRGLRGRGDVEVSMTWQEGAINAALLSFHSKHPWLRGLIEGVGGESSGEEDFRNGFFWAAPVSPEGAAVILEVTSPGSPLQLGATEPAGCAAISPNPTGKRHAAMFLSLSVTGFPCEVTLCGVDNIQCYDDVKDFRTTSRGDE